MLSDGPHQSQRDEEPDGGPASARLFLLTASVGCVALVASVLASLMAPEVALPAGAALLIVWLVFVGCALWTAGRAISARRGAGEALATVAMTLVLSPLIAAGPVVVGVRASVSDAVAAPAEAAWAASSPATASATTSGAATIPSSAPTSVPVPSEAVSAEVAARTVEPAEAVDAVDDGELDWVDQSAPQPPEQPGCVNEDQGGSFGSDAYLNPMSPCQAASLLPSGVLVDDVHPQLFWIFYNCVLDTPHQDWGTCRSDLENDPDYEATLQRR